MMFLYFLDTIKIVKNMINFNLGDRVLTNGGKYFSFGTISYLFMVFK